MKFYCYILQSQSTGKLYIGHTNNVEDRLHRHNANQNKSTKNRGPWVLIYSCQFHTRAEAVQLETKLKKWKSPKRVLKFIDRENN